MNARFRVAIVDDHALVRKGLRMVLEDESDIEVVGEGSSGQEACELVKTERPDVVLLDLTLPDRNGLEVIGTLRALCPKTQVVVLTIHDNEQFLLDALNAGAAGYLLKDSSHRLIPMAVRSVVARGCLVEKRLINRMVRALPPPAPSESSDELPCALSKRELAVLQLIAQGCSNKAIAENLHLAEATVKKYIGSLKNKLSVWDRAQAAAVGVRLGLVD